MYNLKLNLTLICLAVTFAAAQKTNSTVSLLGSLQEDKLESRKSLGNFGNYASPTNSNFQKIGQHFYLLSDYKLNWFDAFVYCRSIGANLAFIESAAELTALSNRLIADRRSGLNEYFWIDGNDQSVVFQFYSFSTGQRLTFTKWSKGQPDNAANNERCLMIWYREDEFKMNDEKCAGPQYFICKATD